LESPAKSERMEEEDDDNEEEEEEGLDFNEEALEVKSWEDEEESELAGLIEPEDDTRHVVELPKLPTSVWKGHCFRPLAAWKNSTGRYEISRETVSVDEDAVELKLVGCDSGEEIARINIPMKDVEKAQVHFGSRTVVHLFVDVDICDAAAQSLAMTNIASFSLVDADARRIRISFQAIGDGEKATLREYFRRNAIFFRVLTGVQDDRIFFKPVRKPDPPKYDSSQPEKMEVFIDTIRTFQYQDRITFTCKVCGFLGESRAQVSHHVSELHIEPRRRLEDRDLVIDYIESHGSQVAG